VVDKYFIFFI